MSALHARAYVNEASSEVRTRTNKS